MTTLTVTLALIVALLGCAAAVCYLSINAPSREDLNE